MLQVVCLEPSTTGDINLCLYNCYCSYLSSCWNLRLQLIEELDQHSFKSDSNYWLTCYPDNSYWIRVWCKRTREMIASNNRDLRGFQDKMCVLTLEFIFSDPNNLATRKSATMLNSLLFLKNINRNSFIKYLFRKYPTI